MTIADLSERFMEDIIKGHEEASKEENKEKEEDKNTCIIDRQWDVYRMYGDYCEDNKQDYLAECLRWQADNKHRPLVDSSSPNAAWFNKNVVTTLGIGDPESDLPEELYNNLEDGKVVANHKSYESLLLAEKALQKAWAKTREGGWTP